MKKVNLFSLNTYFLLYVERYYFFFLPFQHEELAYFLHRAKFITRIAYVVL